MKIQKKTSKEVSQFYAAAAEAYLQNPQNEIHLLLTDKAKLMACWRCGKDTLHERNMDNGWECIYSYLHNR